jgi:hypothetical protein
LKKFYISYLEIPVQINLPPSRAVVHIEMSIGAGEIPSLGIVEAEAQVRECNSTALSLGDR